MVVPLYKVCLDTNVYIDFALIYLKESEDEKLSFRQRNVLPILVLIENNIFRRYVSSLNKWEFRDQLRVIMLQRKIILEGFTSRDWYDAKSQVKLEGEDKKSIGKLVSKFMKYAETSDFEITPFERRTIESLNIRGFEHSDLNLILQAKKAGCKYFVTGDIPLVTNANLLEKRMGIKVISAKQFANMCKRF